MNKAIRFVLVLAVLAGVIFAFGQKAVWAAPPPPIDVPGDVKTGAGPYKLGGCVTGTVKDLKPGFKINVATLESWNSYRTEGLPPMPVYYWTLPGGPDDIFSCVTIIKIMQNDKMLKEFPLYETDQYTKDFPYTKGSAEVCLDTPLDKTGYIYFYDEFKLVYNKAIHGNNYPNWVKVGGPFPGGSKGCVPVTYSGVYGYYAPEAEKDLNDPNKFQYTTQYRRVGSVDVPYQVMTMAKNGVMALGGCVTGNIENLPENKGYKMVASVISEPEGIKSLPAEVGKFYQCIVDLKLYQNDQLINELPKEDGNVTLCFAIPPNHEGTIYYWDKYFDEKSEWKPISNPYKTGIACGPVMKSGYYGMVDVKGNE